MPAKLRKIKIFLASSNELKADRDEFRLYISQLNDKFVDKKIYFEIIQWENFLDAISGTRLQDEYNKALTGADIALCLFYTKVGIYSEEEFNTAYNIFKATGKPLIWTYFKEAPVSIGSITTEINSLLAFKKKLGEMGHFLTVYSSMADLYIKFRNQLDGLLPDLVSASVRGNRVINPSVQIQQPANSHSKEEILKSIDSAIGTPFQKPGGVSLTNNPTDSSNEYANQPEPAPKKIKILPGSAKNEYPEDKSGRWTRIKIQLEPGVQGQQERRFRFTNNPGNFQDEQHDLAINPVIIDTLLNDISVMNKWTPQLAKTIFALLLPHELKEQIKRQANILWVLDPASAAYPWELLQDSATDALPLSCKSGMIRELSLDSYRTGISDVYDNNALIIGDPVLNGFLSQLPGAAKEAGLVADLLQAAGYGMIRRCIGSSSGEIINALFENQYKIIHLAGHGVVSDDPANPSGMIIGNNIFLTAAEIAQLSAAPDLVFINCSFLGKIDPRSEMMQHRNKFAASMGVQLIKQGVKALVVAGWAIDDAAAQLFTRIFYENLLHGSIFGEAVKRARLETFNSHPATNTWGAYQCYGDPFYKITTDQTNSNQKEESADKNENKRKPHGKSRVKK